MKSLLKKLIINFKNSQRGLLVGITEHSFQIELAAGILLIPLLIFIDRPTLLKLLVLVFFFLVLVVELLNTAIEKICNKITLEKDEKIRDIKDIASAAVFLTVIFFGLSLIILFTNCCIQTY